MITPTNTDWSKGKFSHLQLSKKAAGIYDSKYGNENFSTKLYMDYELEVIDKAVKLLPIDKKGIAIDLGCGTGRDTLYNSDALVSQLVNELDWEPSLSVRFTDTKNSLKVVFQGNKFNIAAKTYSVQECRDILSQHFEIVELSTFPTISSVLPNSLFGNAKVKDIFKRIDYKIRFDEKIASGPYICVVCKK